MITKYTYPLILTKSLIVCQGDWLIWLFNLHELFVLQEHTPQLPEQCFWESRTKQVIHPSIWVSVAVLEEPKPSRRWRGGPVDANSMSITEDW